MARWPLAGLGIVLVAGGVGLAGVPVTGTDHQFLVRHWRLPVPPQGPAPPHFSSLERSLDPQSCGTCHPLQLADWKTSLHARSMGPGVAGQLAEMQRADPATARLCLTCHAPLTEQHPVRTLGETLVANPDFDHRLQRQGLVCTSCHVRNHRRYGPPRRDGTVENSPGRPAPHAGAVRVSAFLRSEFCSSCHQFGPDDLTLNGKPLENTYEEWKASPAAQRGRQCQDCHMPDRRHLWRGVHDPEMVRSGIEVTVTTDRAQYQPGDEVRTTVRIQSIGVGHHFPTYVTPHVVVRVALVDRAGTVLPGSVQEHRIAREVALDLSREIFDTRIPAGGKAEFAFRHRIERPGLRVRATVTVYPDHFYTRFFESLLGSGAGAGTAEIRRALEATRRSAFEVFRRELPLT
jgi:hypothetical protein